MPLTITLQELKQHFEFRRLINSIPLNEITLLDMKPLFTQEIPISTDVIEAFKFTGLNNIDFFETEYYKN